LPGESGNLAVALPALCFERLNPPASAVDHSKSQVSEVVTLQIELL
jgi:hypothetical protein